ncbi:hypothetical protein [Glacieibacterium frigidum]|uniref:Uncharacterized protein n=1 Tax=Glacieibacterium frigidum TaxID=2593303 RepID=A0A552U830_9SPHN|nr:hypothetical protein [Glacieibacterium frigidum]TRW14374.1 hypothetical protein FMM06_11725 [Glacieibacterium frigidum]
MPSPEAARLSERSRSMPHRTPALADPVRSAAYFAALAETHSLVAAASAAGIGNPAVSHYRRRHPEFDAQVNAVLGRPLDHDSSRRTFSNARQRIFLDRLAESGCARDAAEAAGVSGSTPYGLRRRDMKFAAAWAAARDEAVDRAFGRLLHQSIHGFVNVDVVGGIEKRSVRHEAGTVLKLLDRYDAKRSRQPGTGRFVELTPERVAAARTSILRRLNDGGSLITMAEAVRAAGLLPATTPATAA